MRAKAVGHGELEKYGLAAVTGAGSAVMAGLRRVTVSLRAMQTIADAEECPTAVRDSRIEELLAAGTGYGHRERARGGAPNASVGTRAGEGGSGRYAAGAVACYAIKGVGVAGICVSPKPDTGPTGAGSTNAAEIEATRAAPQGQPTYVPAGEAPDVVTASGDIEADGARVHKPAGGVCQRFHGDTEGRLCLPGGGLLCGKPAAGNGGVAVSQL